MSKGSFQKGKILYLLELLKRETDEDHAVSMERILQYLNNNGISAERKSIYSDIEVLRQMGYDIEYKKGKNSGYCLLGGEFELPELKLLVDAVQASKFITEKKSRELIGKLENLTNKYNAGELQRHVVVDGRIKSMNESIYYNVDQIHNAMNHDRSLFFHYSGWNVKKELIPRRDGELYRVSPWTLLWTEENYYMIGYDMDSQGIKYYRVDKMRDIECSETLREGRDEFEKIDMSQFAKRTFGMYAGEERELVLLCKDEMAGVILDRFGVDIPMYEKEDGKFICHIKVKVSPQFFGWVTSIGDKIKIVEPEDVKEDYKKFLMRVVIYYFS